MKFRKGNWRINLDSFIRLQWKRYYPKLILHEKFEKPVKWILRILAAVGIVISFLTLPYWIGVIITLIIFGVEQLFENVVFEYSVIVQQPLPDFEIEYDQWLTNGWLKTAR